MGIRPGWDCGRCRLDGPNGLLLHCRILREDHKQQLDNKHFSYLEGGCLELGDTLTPMLFYLQSVG